MLMVEIKAGRFKLSTDHGDSVEIWDDAGYSDSGQVALEITKEIAKEYLAIE